ncbi:MAG: class I SAM-dependent methyltransferase [Rhodospirillaceae bacterium]|jgi:2-polyprenyl-3-methyl-5-hydroxy-6-metoxy-1,4-benzoquinol methylase|nr:class I SAM-dependent methyltransferase [Rhodospirillaceae bacterium]MBT3492337.1 class I SAM-dependent methyltransferase [Rhodospirillaceae bacterium]MBT3782378.1 class I SAM-dependent methyltransferase [Rhodospirillaceae bacterium]MBT3975192.1 class I SAM-dependent methyltransferase [Rhodospirillaceae bacterium]MBT4166874.1 class I SAM-dependent methyltransferase [Rhodospirillaceae bacterium]
MTSNEWDEFAAEWDGNTATSAYADHAFAELAQVVDLAGLRVFDFGCGTGLLAERLSPHVSKVVALDGSSKMIEQLKLKALPNVFPIAGFLTASLMRRNTLLQTKFDLVTASSVCAFLPDYGAILQTLRSLLRSGGTYVQWDWLASEESTETGFTKRRVRRAMAAAGFINIALTQPFTIEKFGDDTQVLMAVGQIP